MAGPQAELLEDRQADQETDPEQLEAVRNLLSELTKTAKIFRTYPRDNAMSISAMDKLAEVFTAYFESWKELELFVERERLIFNGETVHEDDSPRRSIPVKLDRSGIRRLLFFPGITHEEIVNLLDVLTAELDDESLQDDIVTLMWDKQFTHVKVFVLDELTDDEQYGVGKVGASDPGTPEKTEPEEDELSPEERHLRDLHNAAQLAASCAEMKTKLPPLTEQDVQALKTEAALQETRDVSTELVGILFELLRHAQEDASSANVRHVLGQLVIMRMRAANFAEAAKLLQQIEELADGADLDQELAGNLREMTRTLFSNDHVGELRDILLANPGADIEGLEGLAAYFPEDSLGKMVSLMSLDRDQKELQDLFLKVYSGRPQTLVEPLIEADEVLGPRIMDLFEQLADESHVGVLGELLPRLKGDLRTRVVTLMAKFPTDEIKSFLLALISDADPVIRRTVIKTLTQFQGGFDANDLRSKVFDKDFDERSLEEKKGLLMALAQAEQAGMVELLVQIIEQKKWFESTKHKETRECAMLALGQTGTDKARQTLEKHAQDKDESIRGAARLALSNMKARTAVGS